MVQFLGSRKGGANLRRKFHWEGCGKKEDVIIRRKGRETIAVPKQFREKTQPRAGFVQFKKKDGGGEMPYDLWRRGRKYRGKEKRKRLPGVNLGGKGGKTKCLAKGKGNFFQWFEGGEVCNFPPKGIAPTERGSRRERVLRKSINPFCPGGGPSRGHPERRRPSFLFRKLKRKKETVLPSKHAPRVEGEAGRGGGEATRSGREGRLRREKKRGGKKKSNHNAGKKQKGRGKVSTSLRGERTKGVSEDRKV